MSSSVRRRLRAALVAIAMLATATMASAQSTDERAAVESGRAIGRMIVFFQARQMCAIAALRRRCAADFEALVARLGNGRTLTDADVEQAAGTGPQPLTRMRRFFSSGNLDDADPRWSYLSTVDPSDGMRTANPHLAWLFDAGEAAETSAAAMHNMALAALAARPYSLMAQQLTDGAPYQFFPPGVAPRLREALAKGELPPDLMGAVTDGLPDLVTRAFPPRAWIEPTKTGLSPAAYAEFGVMISTVNELVDVPRAAALPESQRQFDLLVERGRPLMPGGTEQLNALRAALRISSPFDPEVYARAHQRITELLGFIPRGPTYRAFLVGLGAAQVAFNAAVVHESEPARLLLEMLGQNADADGAFPGLTTLRARAAAIPPTDWAAQYRVGTAIVDQIVGE
jgi:hypothetical protein